MGFPDLTGAVLEGRYRVGEALGVGGMGAVFEAEHIRLGRRVALKVMRPLYMQYRHHVARFLQEARAASQVKHPNVVEILDVGETPEGTVYTVMELLDGEDLASILRREQRLPWPRVHDTLTQVVSALEAAHEQGVIHRDVKPANCILVRGKKGEPVVKMVDFGIAKFHDDRLSDDDDPLTKTGEVIGTPAYMAPELALGKAANARTDIYSVGVLAYQMLTGERPFGGATAVEMHLNQTTRPPEAPRKLEPSIPIPVEALILQMLAPTPGNRPLNMARVAHELRMLTPRVRNTLSMSHDLSRRRASMPAQLPRTPRRTQRWPVDRDVTLDDGPRLPDHTSPGAPVSVDEPPGELADWDDIETRLVDAANDADDWDNVKTTRVDSEPVKMAPPAEDAAASPRAFSPDASPTGPLATAPLTPSASISGSRSRGDLFKTIPVDPEAFRRNLRTPSDPAQLAPPQLAPPPLVPAQPGVPQLRAKQTLTMGSSGSEPMVVEPPLGEAPSGETPGGSPVVHWSTSTQRTPISSSDHDLPVVQPLSRTSVVPIMAAPPPSPARTSAWPVIVIAGLVVTATAGAAYWWWPELRTLLGG